MAVFRIERTRDYTLNAHYTSPMVIRAIYETVERLGFHNGNILEPSCGVGNFFGMLPDSMAGSRLYGVELDSITGRIARQLYPNARIEVNGFEKTQYPDGIFDLAIGNVPFGNYRVSDRPYSLGGDSQCALSLFADSQPRAGGTASRVCRTENGSIRLHIIARSSTCSV